MPRIITINDTKLEVLGANQPADAQQPSSEQEESKMPELLNTDIDEVPPRYILNTNIKGKLKKVQVRRKALKLEHAKHEFQEQVQKALNLFDKNDDIYDTDIIMLCCEIAENFFIERGMGFIKHECVVNACLKYFDNNRKIIDKIIDLVMPNIEQVRMRRRLYIKAKNLFFSALSCLAKKS